VTTLRELGQERFVSLTTYRRTGETVPTPVWVVDRGDALLVWTPAGTGKVKRLRRDPRVTLAPCSRRGRVPADAPHVVARASVETSPIALSDVRRLLARKYGLEFRLVGLVERLVSRRSRERVVLRIVPS
jgi:uncharacterized protein